MKGAVAVLKDQSADISPMLSKLVLIKSQNISAANFKFIGAKAKIVIKKPYHRLCKHRLSAAAISGDRDAFVLSEGEIKI